MNHQSKLKHGIRTVGHPFFLSKVRQRCREVSVCINNSLNTEYCLTKTCPQSMFVTQGTEQIIVNNNKGISLIFLSRSIRLKKPNSVS